MFLLRKANHLYLWIIGSLFFIILLVVILNKFNIFYINLPEDDKQADIFMLKFSIIVAVIAVSICFYVFLFI